MFVSSCYFIYNARKNTAAEKECDIDILMTLRRVQFRDSRKKKWAKKVTFNKDMKMLQNK